MPRPRVLVLGAEGMLGGMLCRVLSLSGRLEVVGSSRRGAPPWLPFDAESGDPGELLRSVGGADYAVNAIAVLARDLRAADPLCVERAHRVNGGFPRRLCAAAAGAGTRVFLVSTDAVFAPDQGVCVESSKPQARDVYGLSKLRGEVHADHVLNLRCSLIGPGRPAAGLLEWVRGRPAGTVLSGYVDQRWNGVTTLQLARLCEAVITRGLFQRLRDEAPVHHVCPNATVTKFELLLRLRERYRPDLDVRPVVSGTPILRELATELRSVPALLGSGLPIASALDELRKFEGDGGVVDGPA